MPPFPSPRRQSCAAGAATSWLLVACGLLGTGCGQTSPAPSARLVAAAGDDSLRLFPSGPGLKLSPEAAAVVSRSARPPRGPAGSAAVIASFPPLSSGGPARSFPAAKPSLRTAGRLDGGATTVR